METVSVAGVRGSAAHRLSRGERKRLGAGIFLDRHPHEDRAAFQRTLV